MVPSAVVNVVHCAAAVPDVVSAAGVDGTSDGVGAAGVPVAVAEAAAEEDCAGCRLPGCGEQPATSITDSSITARDAGGSD